MFDPWVGKIPWRRESLPTPVFWLENFLDGIVHGVAKSRTRLSDFHFHFLSLSARQVILKLLLWPQDDHYVTSIGGSIQSLSQCVSHYIPFPERPTSQGSTRNASQAHACTSLPLRGGRDHHGWLHCLPGAYGERRERTGKKSSGCESRLEPEEKHFQSPPSRQGYH